MYIQFTSCVYGDGMPEQKDMAPMAPVSIFSLNLKENQLRSSHQTCFMKRVVLRNFAKFTGKHLCQSPFFNKVAGLGPVTLLKKGLWHRCFPVDFAKFVRAPFWQNTSGRLLSTVRDWKELETSIQIWHSP